MPISVSRLARPAGSGSIGDYLWLDADSDGAQDAGRDRPGRYPGQPYEISTAMAPWSRRWAVTTQLTDASRQLPLRRACPDAGGVTTW